MDIPETPEGVALFLVQFIIASGGKPLNIPPRWLILDLFAECLAAVMGKRESEEPPALH